MLKRRLENIAKQLFNQFPVLTITGPRQSGKTVLVQQLFVDLPYYSLEDPDIRHFAVEDPRGFLNSIPDGGVIDEIQRVPELVSYIQTIVDKKRKNGLFVLTGSSQFELHHAISQSLAGRTALLQLLPFTLDEVYADRIPDMETCLYNCFYPRIFDQSINPTVFLRAYTDTYLERDVRTLMEIRNRRKFDTFIRLCAGRTGQILNLTSLGNDCGISNKTAAEWISVLEASYLVVLLKPYHSNFNKRLIKAPKLYFLDVGLAAYLLGIDQAQQIKSHPLRGALFETLIISEFYKNIFNQGKTPTLYYFRDNTGNEIDLLLETNGQLIPIEIKSGATVNTHFFSGLKYMTKIALLEPGSGILIYGGQQHHQRSSGLVVGYQKLAQLFIDLNR